MERINTQKDGLRRLATNVLSWITCAERPLTTRELQNAIAIEDDTPVLDEDNLTEVEDIVSVCAGLVTIDEESNIIRLVHYTTQEYFVQTQQQWFPDAQMNIAKACVTYLSFKDFGTGFCPTDKAFNARLQANALYSYAARHWGNHIHKAALFVQKHKMVLHFLESEMNIAGASQAMLVSGSVASNGQYVSTGAKALHLATYFDLKYSTIELLQRGHDPEVKDSDGQTPLMWAINNGHENIVGLLLMRKLDFEASDNLQRTALHHSACIGQINSMKLLIQCRAGLETRDSLGRTPLLSAINRGQAAAVEYLLEVGADPAAFDEQRKGALHLSIESDLSIQLVALLVAHGAPVDIIDIDNMSPLHGAVQYNRRGIASLLLNNGVSIDFGIQRRCWIPDLLDGNVVYELNNTSKLQEFQTPGIGGLTALHFAALVGNAEMTEFLLSQGADPNRLSQYQETPLHLAFSKRVQGPDYRDAWNKDFWRIECLWDFVDFDDEDEAEAEAVATRIAEARNAVVETLLKDDRTNVTLQDAQGSSILHVINYREPVSSNLLWCLIHKGAILSARNADGQTALHLASLAGNFESTQVFINGGSDIQLADTEGRSAIHCTAASGDIETVMSIFGAHEISVLLTLKDTNGRTALHYSLGKFCSVDFDLVQLLLRLGCNPNDIDADGNSPLAHYLKSFQISIDTRICLLLLQNGTNAAAVNERGQTLAELYVTHGKARVEVLQLLYQYGVEIAKIDSEGKTILHRMALRGSLTEEALQYLLSNTIICPSMRDSSGKTALQCAVEEAGRIRSPHIWDRTRWSRTANILRMYAA